MVKIYAEITDTPMPYEGDEKVVQNLFKNKNGDFGYIIIQNNKHP